MNNTLTLDNLKALSADPQFAELMADCLLWQTVSECLREKIDRIHTLILSQLDLRVGAKLGNHLNNSGQRITSPKDMFLAADDDPLLAEYYRLGDFANRQMGYNLPPNHCPALIAEHALCKAERALLEYADAKLGTPLADTYLDNRKKALAIVEGIAVKNPQAERSAQARLPRSEAQLIPLIHQAATRLDERKAA